MLLPEWGKAGREAPSRPVTMGAARPRYLTGDERMSGRVGEPVHQMSHQMSLLRTASTPSQITDGLWRWVVQKAGAT